MRILITGATGFAGSHLADQLLTQDAVELWGAANTPDRPEYLDKRLQFVQVDLRNPVEVEQLLASIRPERIYHLAGQAFVPQSWADPWETLEDNIRPQLNIIQVCLRHNLLDTRILSVCSNEEYGRLSPEELPARENSPFRADSPYGVSKLAQDFLAQAYFLSHHLPIIRVRPFNHIGPRQKPTFSVPSFARQIALIEAGRTEPTIHVGNLDARRDLSDVRDVVEAYERLMTGGERGRAYNICSGVAVRVGDVLDQLVRLSRTAVRVIVDPDRLRPEDAPLVLGDPARIQRELGWSPQHTLPETLRDTLDWWRAQVPSSFA